MRNGLVLSGWLAIALIAVAFVPAARSAATGTPTVSCAPGERRLYVTVYGAGVSGVQLYCADRMTPAGLIPFAKERMPQQILHDRAGNLFVMAGNPVRDESELSILDPTGAVLADRAEPYGLMFVDKNRSLAYLISRRRLANQTETMGGHPVYFAQFELLLRSAGITRDSKDVAIPGVARTNAVTIDPLGRILMNSYGERAGDAAIIDPQKQKVVGTVYAPACTVAGGADGLVYALNCLGELRIFDPKDYHLKSDLKLDIGGPYLGDANYQGRMAIDATGTVFVSNGKLQTLLRYKRGETKPSATALDVPRIVDLELDSAGNVYALEGGDSAVKSSIRVFSGDTLQQIREYDFVPPGYGGYGMTIVDP